MSNRQAVVTVSRAARFMVPAAVARQRLASDSVRAPRMISVALDRR